jgi:hypothetical protein
LTVMMKWKEPYSNPAETGETPFWASKAAFFIIFLPTSFTGKAGTP